MECDRAADAQCARRNDKTVGAAGEYAALMQIGRERRQRRRIDASVAELIEERDAIKELGLL